MPDESRALSDQVCMRLEDKTAPERAGLAQRLKERLEQSDLTPPERRAIEELARQLAHDAVEMVRHELMKAVKHCRFLPRDIALRIAHDIDSIACPFLEVSEVFSEEDWQQLMLTVSPAARVAMACRLNLGERLVNSLAQVGEIETAETLVSNDNAPITALLYSTLAERFPDHPTLLERMAERSELPAEIVVQLISKVSEAAREKLACTYNIEDFTAPATAEAQTTSFLRIIRSMPGRELRSFAETLNQRGQLSPFFLRRALDDGLLSFFEAGMAVRARITVDDVRRLIRFGGEIAITKLCDKAQIPAALKNDFQRAIENAVSGETEPPQATAQLSDPL
jgi:uncharacterized protein (DUF2336 family)